MASRRTTLECTYRTVGKVRRPFTPIRTLFAHYLHSRRIVFTAILTLFAHYSHGRILFARSHTIRTPFAQSHTIRTLHNRTVAHYSKNSRSIISRFTLFTARSRGSHTICAIVTSNSHSIRISSTLQSHYSRGGGETIRTHARSIRAVHTRSHL